MALSGRILRFDDVRGYGFIAPDGGGADVFVHANELNADKGTFKAGTPVEFEVMDGERGPKAFSVRLLDRPKGNGSYADDLDAPFDLPDRDWSGDDDSLCDVLTPGELNRELTELFLSSVPELTGAQIIKLRESILTVAKKHGWVED
ncbi:putative cold-shock DNA-binding protein [Actinocorallia herbida]|uniref:Putative cold-shock DNA-binding protein n=1 Tax=Actinocorallia herbida TaxID=58109 RepID=A0A3N1D4X8_9ACTN|nr:cold shock domain-containing protein [Actinocorallia herbida]ROO88603.1 putative cold-shock DNA-binding protein [Actinocorallia herbida]